MIGARQDDAAAALYVGQITHARLKPVVNRFTYRMMNLVIDLDRLGEADHLSWFFWINRAGLYSFHERDHGPRDGSPLRTHANRIATQAGIDLTGGRVRLLCYPRLLGYVFNPLSVYYCEDAGGNTVLLIYEVRNTFGESHTYVCPVRPGEASAAGIRQETDKQFYVSPFIGMGMRYRFRMVPPVDEVKIRILETDADGPLLAASFIGRRRALTNRQILAAFFMLPLMTVKVVAAIHLQAVRLWLKGLRLVPHIGAQPKPFDRKMNCGSIRAAAK